MFNKSNFRFIVISIAVAMVGLISVQIYWIDNAITLREEEFKEDVITVLVKTAERMEKNEALSLIRTSSFGSRLFSKPDNNLRFDDYRNKLHTSYDTSYRKDGNKLLMKVIESRSGDSVLGIRTEERFTGRITQNAFNERTGEAQINFQFSIHCSMVFQQ